MNKNDVIDALRRCIEVQYNTPETDRLCYKCPLRDENGIRKYCSSKLKHRTLDCIIEQEEEIVQMKATGCHKVEKAYIILSPEGGIALNICTGKGTLYTDKAKAEDALKRKNEWSRIKGYGVYELVELEVEE